jgi:aryl carrier-like protein
MEMAGKLIWRTACSGGYASYEETTRLLQDLDQILGHFVRSPNVDVLAFSGKEVSICGLPPVVLRRSEKPSTTSIDGPTLEGSDAWSSLEETIRDVLAEISGVPAATILRSNNIYNLGLDSISAIKAGSLLRKKGFAIGFRDMLKAGSISDMARLVSDALPSPLASDATANEQHSMDFEVPEEIDLPSILNQLGIDEAAVEEVLPASPMQVHMLSVWQNTQGEVFYPEFKFSLFGQIDSVAMDAAWKTLVAETPILRTLFISTDSRSVPILQVVVRHSSLRPSQIAADSTTWESETTGALSQPYNYMHAKKEAEDRWALQLKIHHALYDAISLPAIMDRFAAICCGEKVQEQNTRAFNWGNFLAPHLSENSRAVRERFWTEYLAGTEPPSLRFEHEQLASNSRIGLVKWAALEGVSDIVQLCKDKGVSLQALFFAAYAEFLASAAAERGGKRPERVVFGIYLANRAEIREPGVEAYPLLRLVPIRAVLRDVASLVDIAAEIQEDIHAVSSPVHAEVGLWEIKDWTGVTIDSFVNFLGATERSGSHRDVRLEVEEPATDPDVTPADSRNGQCGYRERPEIAGNAVRDAFLVSVVRV